jgi:hypothetical protein
MELARHVLALAVIAASSSAFALDQLSDDTMANTTGQAGLTTTTILPAGGLTGKFDWTDTNGGTGGPAAFAGTNGSAADVQAAFKLTGKSTMTIDVGATAGGAADLLMDISTDAVTGLTTTITSASVCANSNVNTSTGACSASSSILSLPAAGVAITLKGLDLQVLLGASSATQHFITATLPATFNLTIGTGTTAGNAPQLSILDPNNNSGASTQGGIGVSELLVAPTGASTTTVDACTTTATAFCTAALTGGLPGLLVQSNATLNITAYNTTLGNVAGTPTAAIGNVGVYGLSMNGTSTMISGH